MVATTIGFRHFLQVWLSRVQRVHCFSLFLYSTTSSAIPSWAFFQSVCSSLELLLFRFAVVVREDFHQEVLSFRGLFSFFFSNFVLNPFSDPSRLRFGAGLCGVDMDFDSFPRSRSSSSCLPTSRKVSIQWSSSLNLKWDNRRRISCRSLLSTLTLHAIPVRPPLMLRFSRSRRYVSILPLW